MQTAYLITTYFLEKKFRYTKEEMPRKRGTRSNDKWREVTRSNGK